MWALFDTGARASYISAEIGEKLGYVKYFEVRKVPLAVKEKEGEVVGSSHVDVEIAGCPMPEMEALGVIKDLRGEAMIGMDIIEKYDLILDTKNGKVKLKKCPPELVLI